MKQKVKKNNYTLLKQLVVAVLLSTAFYQMIESSRSYTWIFGVMKKNLSFIEEHPDLSYDQKMQIKHGFKYSICEHINKHTPVDAVVLIPSKDAVKKAVKLDNNKSTSQSLANKGYASYFIYPRVFIYPDEKDVNPLWGKITHVTIIDSQGYEYLPYQVKNKSQYQLLPFSLKK